MVAEQGDGGAVAGEADDAVAVRAAVDEVAEQHDPVVLAQVELVEQVFEFAVAAVNVADGDEASGHVPGFC